MWLLVRTALLLLVTHSALGVQDVKLGFAQDGWCNPSLVEFGDESFSSVKTTTFKCATVPLCVMEHQRFMP